MKRSKVDNVKAGDVIVGLASLVRLLMKKVIMAVWKQRTNSARHDVFEKYLATKYPESLTAVPEDLIYSGQVKLTDAVENSPIDAGQLVLSPTRTYAPIIKKILDKYDAMAIHGMVHCSGGAQTKFFIS
jgi:phosphoribosylformylglycinamidine cyclo-ligase